MPWAEFHNNLLKLAHEQNFGAIESDLTSLETKMTSQFLDCIKLNQPECTSRQTPDAPVI